MRFIMLALTPVLSACSSAPEYSQAEIAAIETREVNAGAEATFTAAAGALFDAGFTITMSDRAGGILGAERGGHPHPRGQSHAHSSCGHTITVHVQPRGAAMTSVRIKLAHHNEQVVDKALTDEIWLLMQRQVTMKAPPAGTRSVAPAR